MKNGKLYTKYEKMAEGEEKVILGGDLMSTKYYDMDVVIVSVLDMCVKELR